MSVFWWVPTVTRRILSLSFLEFRTAWLIFPDWTLSTGNFILGDFFLFALGTFSSSREGERVLHVPFPLPRLAWSCLKLHDSPLEH